MKKTKESAMTIEKKIQFNCRSCETTQDITVEQAREFFPDIDKIFNDIDQKAAEAAKDNKGKNFKSALAKLMGYCCDDCFTFARLAKIT